jgi:PTH1 family peptidyl-tRNA hydrolase
MMQESTGEISGDWLLIVGLGNPGRRYAGNRHNVGYHCLDLLAERHGLTFDVKRGKADLAIGRIGGRRAILAKPQAYVNVSGEAVAAVARFYKVAPGDVLVIYDDLDLPQGTIRLRPWGSSGGHNGIKSVIEHLGTQRFPRLRVGIGRPPGRMEPKDYVLQDFGPIEREGMLEVYERAIDAVEAFIRLGVREAMNQFNARPGLGQETPVPGKDESG